MSNVFIVQRYFTVCEKCDRGVQNEGRIGCAKIFSICDRSDDTTDYHTSVDVMTPKHMHSKKSNSACFVCGACALSAFPVERQLFEDIMSRLCHSRSASMAVAEESEYTEDANKV